tara:strand:+ start:676 stop:1272 length:597 start_codon:yes stop_codon:yes gene_type:complete
MSTFFATPESFEPKRKFRFLVYFSGLDGSNTYMVTKATKPSYELSGVTEHRILNHTFKFPGIVKWNDIEISLIDAMEPNVGSRFYNVLRNMGYVNPVTSDNLAAGMTKRSSTLALGEIKILQLDGGSMDIPAKADLTFDGNPPSGVKWHEEWVLHNAFLKSIKWGDMDYSSEDIVTVDLGITYDYAEYNVAPNGVPVQ